MPSHKVLQSVARSVADSFASLMNYADDDYVLGHLLNVARASGRNELSVDLLTGKAGPSELLGGSRGPFNQMVLWRLPWLGRPQRVRSNVCAKSRIARCV